MIDGAFALAFAAGMVATFNPCGFAMLPAYLAYFLGMEDESPDPHTAVLRALKVSAVLTAGFVLVFGLTGALISWGSIEIRDRLPWVTIAIGVVLIGLGIAFLFGKELTLGLPKLEKGTGSRQLGSMFLFGLSYAIASLSCTIGPFFAVTAALFDDLDFASGVVVFVMYGLGMGLVLSVLTIAVALAKQGIVSRMRGALKYVHRVSGALLVLAGAYLAWFGYWELYGGLNDAGPAQFFWDLNSDLSNRVNDVGATRVGLVLAAIIVIVVALTWGWWAMNKPVRDAASVGVDAESDEREPVG